MFVSEDLSVFNSSVLCDSVAAAEGDDDDDDDVGLSREEAKQSRLSDAK